MVQTRCRHDQKLAVVSAPAVHAPAVPAPTVPALCTCSLPHPHCPLCACTCHLHACPVYMHHAPLPPPQLGPPLACSVLPPPASRVHGSWNTHPRDPDLRSCLGLTQTQTLSMSITQTFAPSLAMNLSVSLISFRMRSFLVFLSSSRYASIGVSVSVWSVFLRFLHYHANLLVILLQGANSLPFLPAP